MHECAVTFVNFGLQSLYDLFDGETLSNKPPAAIRSNAEGWCWRTSTNSTAYWLDTACKVRVSLPQQLHNICNFGFAGLTMVKLPEKRLSLQF